MYCSKCKEKGEKKDFLTFSFWYCHICRDEIKDDVGAHDPSAPLFLNELAGPTIVYDGAQLTWTSLTGSLESSVAGKAKAITPPSQFDTAMEAAVKAANETERETKKALKKAWKEMKLWD